MARESESDTAAAEEMLANSGSGAPELTRRGRQSRVALIEAAAIVFGRDGFINARIGDIVAEAGLSHGSFYTYFKSKEAIFREVIDVIKDDMTRRPDRLQVSDDPYQLVMWSNQHFIEVYRRNAALMATLEQVSTFNPDIAQYRTDIRKGYVERNSRAIRRWQAEGRADPNIDARYAAIALGAMVDRLVYIWLVQGEELNEALALETLTRLWVQSLGLNAPDPQESAADLPPTSQTGSRRTGSALRRKDIVKT